MTFLTQLNKTLDRFHLLQHPFYLAWSCGHLNMSTLQTYAQEYYHHVAAFPRYISAIHSRCESLPDRQILLGNLIEEEQGENNHPELWQRFTEGLGTNRNAPGSEPYYPATQKLVTGYFELTEKGYPEGLGALYAYERQTPAVSHSKIKGLQEFYGISDARTLEFFTVHEKEDEWHSDECAELINHLNPSDQARVQLGAEQGAHYLWQFLDQMMELDKKTNI